LQKAASCESFSFGHKIDFVFFAKIATALTAEEDDEGDDMEEDDLASVTLRRLAIAQQLNISLLFAITFRFALEPTPCGIGSFTTCPPRALHPVEMGSGRVNKGLKRTDSRIGILCASC
jgi:hypothetical protein